MLRLVARRLAAAALTLLLVSLLVFLLIHLAPGEPLGSGEDDEGGNRLSPRARAELHALYRLDRPLHVQYGLWLADLARGDLGRSIQDRRPVTEKIRERLGVSLTLNGLSLLLMVGLAVPLGAAAALRPGSAWDHGSALATYVLYAIPVFWGGLLLQMFLAFRLDWLPFAGLRSQDYEFLGPLAQGLDRAAHLVLPVICLSYGGLAYLSRFVRATLLENTSAEAWRAARARGLSMPAILLRHAFPQAAVPMLTLAGFLLPALVGGSVIVETIFAIPGLGRLFVEAAFQRDIPVLLGLTLLSGSATVLGILAADLTYALVDPRVKHGR